MKKFISAALVSAMMLTLLGSCQSGGGSSTASESGTSSESSVSSSETASESSEESSEAPSESSEEASSEVEKLGVEMNIAFLKGPTGLGALELMDEEEMAVLRRGRNAHGTRPPRSSDPADYRRATGVEALFGYLYLCGRNGRIRELFGEICRRCPAGAREENGQGEE